MCSSDLSDIPKIREALKISVKVNILKGRSNYICKLRMENTNQEGLFFNKDDAKYLHSIKAFSDSSDTGEISEISKIPENSSIWPLVTSTKENCLGQDCEFYKDCFLVKARKEALESEVLIVNHHLFFADFVLKDAELSEILPKANTVIFDEAHQVPLVASFFLGQFISSSQIINLIQDCQQSFIKYPDTLKILDTLALELQDNIFELKKLISSSSARLNIDHLQDYDSFKKSYESLIEKLNLLEKNGLACFHKVGSDFLMTTILIFESIEKNNPVTLLKKLINQLILKYLDFNGLIISDDICIKALRGSIPNLGNKCLEAGCDIVLHCNGDYNQMYSLLENLKPARSSLLIKIIKLFNCDR